MIDWRHEEQRGSLDDGWNYLPRKFLLIYPVLRFQFHASGSPENKTFSHYYKAFHAEFIETYLLKLQNTSGGFFADSFELLTIRTGGGGSTPLHSFLGLFFPIIRVI